MSIKINMIFFIKISNSLDELLLLHFTSLSFVVHVVWEMFIVFDHFVLILKSHVFECRT